MLAALRQDGAVAVVFRRGNNTIGFHLFNQAGGAVVADAQLALDIGNAGLTRFQDNGNGFVIHGVEVAVVAAAGAGKVFGGTVAQNSRRYSRVRQIVSGIPLRGELHCRRRMRRVHVADSWYRVAGTAYRLGRAGFPRPFGQESCGCRFCWILGRQCVSEYWL